MNPAVVPAGRLTVSRRSVVAPSTAKSAPIAQLLFDWKWMALFFNRVNTAMGKNPLYPFEISKPVADKLGFVHQVLRESAA